MNDDSSSNNFPQYSLLPEELQHLILSGTPENINIARNLTSKLRKGAESERIDLNILQQPKASEIDKYLKEINPQIFFLTYRNKNNSHYDLELTLTYCDERYIKYNKITSFKHTTDSYFDQFKLSYCHPDYDYDENIVTSNILLTNSFTDDVVMTDIIYCDIPMMHWIICRRLELFGVDASKIISLALEYLLRYVQEIAFDKNNDGIVHSIHNLVYLIFNARLLLIPVSREHDFIQFEMYDEYLFEYTEEFERIISRLYPLLIKRIKQLYSDPEMF